jgi:uncharacterized phosphosugar-binding protein
MQAMKSYCTKVLSLIEDVARDEQESVERAADLVADTIERDQLVHVFGTGGHSSMGAQEMFWRAGGLVPINPILEQGISLAHGAIRSNMIERLPGYAQPVLDYYHLEKDETLIIVNAYGINSMTIDSALTAKEKELRVIAVTSPAFARAVPSDHPARHPSKKSLHELDIDVLIDNHMPVGDAIVSIEGFEQKVSPVSTILNAFVLNSLVACTVEKLVERGVTPPIWMSANMPGGDEANKRYLDAYFYRVKHL